MTVTWQRLLYITPPVEVCDQPRWVPGDIGSVRLQGGGWHYFKRARPPGHPLYNERSNGAGHAACRRCPGCIAYAASLHRRLTEQSDRLVAEWREATRLQAAMTD